MQLRIIIACVCECVCVCLLWLEAEWTTEAWHGHVRLDDDQIFQNRLLHSIPELQNHCGGNCGELGVGWCYIHIPVHARAHTCGIALLTLTAGFPEISATLCFWLVYVCMCLHIPFVFHSDPGSRPVSYDPCSPNSHVFLGKTWKNLLWQPRRQALPIHPAS